MRENKNFYLFLLSLILGLIILFFEIFYNQNSANFINNRAIAKVNDQYINEDQFLKYAITLGADFKAEEDEELIDLVLERMIEEELLVQRAIELKLHQQDIQVRKVLIEQIIEFILQLENVNPSDEQLKQYFINNIGKYSSDIELKIDSIFLKSKSEGSAMLGSEYDFELHQNELDNVKSFIETYDFSAAKQKFNEPGFFIIPNGLIKYKDCIQYLGPTICNNLKSLNPGTVTEPVFYNNGFYFLKLVEIKKSLAEAKDFSKFREQIIFDYQNYEDDQAFIKYIEFLKSRASITKYDLK